MIKKILKRPLLVGLFLATAAPAFLFVTITPVMDVLSSLMGVGTTEPVVGGTYAFLVLSVPILIVTVLTRNGPPSEYKDYANSQMDTPVDVAYVQVANNLNVRIKILESRSLLIYWSMICVIVAGVLLILFSGYLSSMDSYATNLWSLVEQGNPSAPVRFINSLKADEPVVLSETDKRKLDSYLIARDRLATAMTEVLKSRMDDGKSFNVSSTILRVSILGMLIFLVQILMQLYRYNSRLITFYSSRRDAIMLSKGEGKATHEFAQLLLPTGFDFGKELSHPFAEAALAFKESTINLKSRVSQRNRAKTNSDVSPTPGRAESTG